MTILQKEKYKLYRSSSEYIPPGGVLLSLIVVEFLVQQKTLSDEYELLKFKGPFRDPQPHPPNFLQESWDFYISRSL